MGGLKLDNAMVKWDSLGRDAPGSIADYYLARRLAGARRVHEKVRAAQYFN
jgi:hypothetical protein